MVQRLGDLLRGRRTDVSRLAKSTTRPTLKTAVPGDLSFVLPHRHLTSIIEALRAFDTVNIVGVLRGGGDVRAATVIDLTPMWLVALPLAALFGLVFRWSIFWVYMGIMSEQWVKFGIGLRRMRSRAWINDVTQYT